jgi:hypothetical protein
MLPIQRVGVPSITQTHRNAGKLGNPSLDTIFQVQRKAYDYFFYTWQRFDIFTGPTAKVAPA